LKIVFQGKSRKEQERERLEAQKDALWIGERVTCNECGSVVCLEVEDHVHNIEDSYSFTCPNCCDWVNFEIFSKQIVEVN